MQRSLICYVLFSGAPTSVSAVSNLLHVLDKNSQNAVNNAAKELRRNYAKKVADKLANLTKNSLKILSRHFAAASTSDGGGKKGSGASGAKDKDLENVKSASGLIVFVLTAHLSMPEIEVSPSIDEVQGILVQVRLRFNFCNKKPDQLML